VGRDAELAAVWELLDARVGTEPAGLALWGDAGIGKTTVWQAGIVGAHQRGWGVLACRPAAGELRLSYVGLTDLLADVSTAVFNGLAVPQRRALDAALLLGDEKDPAPDERAVAAAFLSVLNARASAGPVLVAIDDIQWLDGPTRRVVGYAMRRCRGPIAVLTAERAKDVPDSRGWLSTPNPERMLNVRVEALSVGALHHVIRNETGRSFSRPTMIRIARFSVGNPFYALEIARTVLPAASVGPAALPMSVDHLVRDRLVALDSSVRHALLVASAVAEPSLVLLRRVCGVADVAGLLTSAEDCGLVELSGGRVRFTHPLWANAVYNDASPGRRRALHRQLGGLVEDVEERARHLALATTELEAATVEALDAAADHARHRGAVSAAAELAELAIGLGATDPARRIRAARDHFDSDDPGRARELLTAAIAELVPGRQRAEALGLLGTIVYESEDFDRSVEILEQAFREAGDDMQLRCSIAMELCWVLMNSRSIAAATSYMAIAVAEAEHLADRGLLAETLGVWVVLRTAQGDDVDTARLDRALALEDHDRRSHALRWPSLHAAVLMAWRHDVEPARRAFAELRDRCVERGAESDLWFVLGHIAEIALWCGDIDSADAVVVELAERARMTASEPIQALAVGLQGIVAAWCGNLDPARTALHEAVISLSQTRFGVAAGYALTALGRLELAVGNHAAAASYLVPAAMQLAAVGYRDPEAVPLGPDAAEALITLGRLDEAEPIVALLENTGLRPGRWWARAVGARCRGLMLASQGDLDGAAAAYTTAIDAHQQTPQLRYDLARTLLVLGQSQRRRLERRDARTSLQEAARLFDEVGAAQWAINARAELDRIGLRQGRSDQLTPSEERVALLAASGLTNREVAIRLFVSAKTVEAHLGRAYRKLGVRTRAELVRRIAEDE